MAKLFCCYGFACAATAGRCSFSASIVIAASAIAAWIAATKPGFISGAVRIAGINKALKDGWITATDSGNTDNGEHRRA